MHAFKLVFLFMFSLAIIFLGIILFIAFLVQNPLTGQQEDLFALSKDALKVLLGAMVGLLGGKTI